MHRLTSNQAVIYNAETQDSGILEIFPEQIVYQSGEGPQHSVFIQCNIKASGTNNYVGGVAEMLTPDQWNTFFASQTLISTTEYDKQQEASLYYVKTKIGGNWGLTSADWIYSNS